MDQVRPDRGTKRICSECGTRYYDLQRVPAICPKCDTEFVAVARPPRTPRAAPKPRGRGFAKPRPAQSWETGEHREDDRDVEADHRSDEDDEDGEEDTDRETE